jgi:hypothetical protein
MAATKTPHRFVSRGVCLNCPTDLMPDGKFAILENIRSYTEGVLESRPGISRIGDVITSQTVVHSVRRLNDDVAGDFTRVVGVADRLATGKTSFAQQATGYSGNPLGFIPLRPDQSPHPWMYISDSSKMSKIREDNTVHSIGVPAPAAAPTAVLGPPVFSNKESFDSYANTAALQAAWKAGGDAADPTLELRVDPASVTVNRILYDTGSTGWCSIQPDNIFGVNPGMFLNLDNAGADEIVIVENVYSGSTATTIGAIIYDSGSSGLCSITLAAPVKQIRTNSLLRIAGAETVRVLSVTPGPEGTECLRCSTTGTRAATNSIQAITSFRCYTAATIVAAEQVRSRVMQSVCTHSTGKGTLTLTAALDFSIFSSTLATQSNDYIHAGVWVSDMANLVEGKIYFDVNIREELVTDGNFASDSDWTEGTGWVIGTTGFATKTAGVASDLEQDISVIEGVTYDVVYTLTRSAGTILARVGGTAGTSRDAAGTYTESIKAGSGTTPRLEFVADSAFAGTVDVVSVKAATFAENYYFYSFRPGDLTPAVKGTATVLANDNTLTRNELVERENKRAREAQQAAIRARDERILAEGGRWITEMVIDASVERWNRTLIAMFGANPANLPDPMREVRRPDLSPLPEIPLERFLQPIDQDPLEPEPGGTMTDAIRQEQIGTGDAQWFELKFRFSDLTRVGTDQSRTLEDVALTRVEFEITADTTFRVDSIYTEGGFGPDMGTLGVPYLYRYRARVSTTGARSNPSPVMRAGIQAFREQMVVTLANHPTTEVDKLDIERFGGNLSDWHYVGTVADGSSPSFTDTFADDAIMVNGPLSVGNFQPWAVIDSPVSGTGTTVAGTSLHDSGTPFNTSWATGTRIKINGINHVIYRVHSTSLLETVQNAGSGSSPVWEINEPVLLQQSLHGLFGPLEGIVFGCGDAKNPGRLYWMNPNSFDSTRDSNWVDVTSPSEPLQNGVVYDGKAYLWSTERLFAIYPELGSALPFSIIEIPEGQGLFAKWGFTGQSSAEGPHLWYVAKDGIYESKGGEPICITDTDLYPLFPHEGVAGEAVNGFNPPDFTDPTNLRLSYHNKWLYFDYNDTSGNRRTLAYFVPAKSWYPDVYTPGLVVHYGEEGEGVTTLLAGGEDTSTSGLFTVTGTADVSTNISAHIRTGAHDEGNPRVGKFYSDFMLDTDTSAENISATLGFDHYANTKGAFTINNSTRARVQTDINSGNGHYGFNIALDLTWATTGATPKVYFWEPLVEVTADILTKWITQETTHGLTGVQHLRDAYVELISSADVTFTIDVDDEEVISPQSYTISSTGGARRKIYVPLGILKGKIFNYYLSSANAFRLFASGSEVRVKSWGSTGGYEVVRPFGDVQSATGGPPAAGTMEGLKTALQSLVSD